MSSRCGKYYFDHYHIAEPLEPRHALYGGCTNAAKLHHCCQRDEQKIKHTFEKGYLPNFSKEIVTISKQVLRDPPMYKLKDYDGEELKGMFYEKELQKVIIR